MDTLVRSTTLRLSHRRSDGYEPLNQTSDQVRRRMDSDDGGRRTLSRPTSSRKQQPQHSPYGVGDSFGYTTFSRPRSQKQQHRYTPVMMNSFSQRRNRAKHRQIYLQTYKLGGSADSSGKSGALKLKKFVVKVKTVVVSVLSFMRADTLKSCNSGSAICASSPSRIAKFC